MGREVREKGKGKSLAPNLQRLATPLIGSRPRAFQRAIGLTKGGSKSKYVSLLRKLPQQMLHQLVHQFY